MYENFYKIDEDKQQRIVEAAMLEFSKYGYQKTSTEQVAKAAGISKSMIFHYFGSKALLFNFLVDYTCDLLLEHYEDFLSQIKELDYIERYHLASMYKQQSYKENRNLTEFSLVLFLSPDEVSLTEEVAEKFARLQQLQVDYAKDMHAEKKDSRLRKDLPKEVSLKYIKWILDGYSQELIMRLKNQDVTQMVFDEDWKDFDQILENLKRLFYHSEGDNNEGYNS